MRNTSILFCLIAFLFGNSFDCQAQKTQSVIYDAVALMNARHGINVILNPQPVGVDIDIIDPITGKIKNDSGDNINKFVSNEAVGHEILLVVMRRNAGLPEDSPESVVQKAYSENPFLKNILNEPILSFNKDLFDAKVGDYETSTFSGATGTSLLNNLANGVADFLIKRAQQELAVSIFEKLQQFLSHYPEFKTLFPKTCELIKPIPAYDFSKTLDALKAAIHDDLEHFVSRIALLYNIPKYQVLNHRAPVLTLIFSASTIVSDLQDKAGIGQSLLVLGKQTYLDEINNYSSFIKLICILSNSLREKRLSQPENTPFSYIRPEFISLVTHNDSSALKELSRMYLGLVWQRIHGITFTTGVKTQSLGDFLPTCEKDQVTSLNNVDQILSGLFKAEADLLEIKGKEQEVSQITGKPNRKMERFPLYGDMIGQALSLTEIFLDTQAIFNVRIDEIRHYWPSFTDAVIEMIKDFDQEQYTLGIQELDKLLRTVSEYLHEVEKNEDKTASDNLKNELNGSLDTQIGILNDAIKKLNARKTDLPAGTSVLDPITNNSAAEKDEINDKLKDLQSEIDQMDWQRKNTAGALYKFSKILDYISLLASVSNAENSAAVEALLETYALPAGSSRVKKVISFSIAINAYVGGFFGRSGSDGKGFTNSYGLTAPIGVTFSKGFEKLGSASLFIGLI
ncbi:MAG TPA: hypothetical protein VK543_09160, partial [Puia sp.]|nr:hypothetical protein [Puia sp.]